jgi:hypothetical protein
MDNSKQEADFAEELKKLMIKYGVSLIMTGEQGGIYCDVKENFFSYDEATIMFEGTQ